MLTFAAVALALAGMLQLVAISRSLEATRRKMALLMQPLTVEELEARRRGSKQA